MEVKYQNNIKSKRRKVNVIGIIIFTIFTLFFLLSMIYLQFIKKSTYNNIYNNIGEISEQTASQLKLSITNQVKFVDVIAEFIDKGYAKTSQDVFDRFEEDLDSYNFTRLVILDQNGNGITSDGRVVNSYPNISEFFEQDTVYLSENRPSTVENYQVNIYSKTFNLNGQKMVLFATIKTENYEKILSRKLFDGAGGTYLINNSGDVLIDSFGQITNNSTRLYDFLKQKYNLSKEDDNKKIDTMASNIELQKAGTFNISFNNELYFINYEEVGINDWYVITIVSANTISKDLMTFLSYTLIICFIINVLMLVTSIYIYISNQKKNQKIYEAAYIDPITKLGNENFFMENSEKILKYTKNSYTMVININQFSTFNKVYDYTFCNNLLKKIGEELKKSLPKNNIVCRISRDTFACAFRYSGDIEKVINKVFEITKEFKIDNLLLNLNLSIGIYKTKFNDESINYILDKAYMAYAITDDVYNNSYYIYDNVLEQIMLETQQIESEMEVALENNEFKVFYQPKINTKDETLAGAEALVRWKKGNSYISPSKFIPLFEKNKFIIKLDLFVFEQVCKDIATWEEKYGYIPMVSVNVSKEHFTNKKFLDDYVKITDKYKIDRNKIELEITESATIDKNIDYVKIITKMKEKGFLVSMDDFGTGYSSLSMLQLMPIDIMKIDKSFIDNADLKSNNNMINYIVFMANQLGVKTIVEGVETKEQVMFIKKLKCDMIQGYYYSKPLDKSSFDQYLEKH